MAKRRVATVSVRAQQRLALVVSKQTLVSSLARLAKQGAVFYRGTKGNTFGLLSQRVIEGLEAMPAEPARVARVVK